MYKNFTHSSSPSRRGSSKRGIRQARSAETPAIGRPLIGALLRFPREVVVQRMLEAVNEHGYDLTPTELGVMMYPGPDGQRPSELARTCAMSRQSMNYLLSGLEERGYLRRADGESGLARVVHLSKRGREAGLLMRRTVEEIEREWTAFLGEARFRTLSDTLLELSRWLGKVP
jgi:DNA-binding MarR family transcriptional regulator